MKKTFFYVLLSLLLGVLIYSKTNTSGPKAKKILVYVWSNYFPEELLQEFTKRTGVEVEVTYIGSNEEVYAKMKAGSEDFDIVMPTDYMVTKMVKAKMLRPIDKSRLQNLSHLDPKLKEYTYDQGMEHSIPFVFGTTGIAVNTEKVDLKGKPVSWELLFKSPDPHRTSMLDDIREVFGAALMYEGKDLNENAPSALESAAETIRKARTNIALFTSEPLALLAKGELTIAHTYSTQGVMAQSQNPKIKYVIPKEGGVQWTDNFAIPMGSKNVESALQFIDFFLEPQNALKAVEYNHTGTVNLTAKRMMRPSPEMAEIYPSDEVLSRLQFMKDPGDSLPVMSRLWTELKI